MRDAGFKLLNDISEGENPPNTATLRADRRERLYVVPERTWARFVEWLGRAHEPLGRGRGCGARA